MLNRATEAIPIRDGHSMKIRRTDVAEVQEDQPESPAVQNHVRSSERRLKTMPALNPQQLPEIRAGIPRRGRIKGVIAVHNGHYFSPKSRCR